ncbi:MAG: hypothetical protein K2I47_00255 [Odoribacter sp.]|nr:hypothetical protein [Odoribacter sp.]
MILKYGEAIHRALHDALDNDEKVFFFGEDDKYNLYGYTEGLYEKFGLDRVRDIPLSEAGIVGIACGAAICGMRPILDLTTENFLYVAMDQICSIAAKTSYMYGGQYSVPITIFCSSMSIGGNAAQHSDRVHSLFMNVPGLKIICPSSPQDMYSMLRTAVEDDNPVLCFADRSLFWLEEDVNFEKRIPLGSAKVVHEGSDLTVISISGCYKYVEEIWHEKRDNLSMEVIDVRSVVPFDFETIKKSIMKTGRVVICDTANRTGCLAGHISSLLAENAFEYLNAPIGIASSLDVPVPYAKGLEQEVLVSKAKILNEINKIYTYGR